MRVTLTGLLAALLLIGTGSALAAAPSQTEIDALKRDVEALRAKVMAQSSAAPVRSSVEQVLENKYGPNANVTSRTGKLQFGGLVQVWYYWIQNDENGLFTAGGGAPAPIADTNTCSDNDSFRIRRAELSFKMDIHENVTAFVMIDPATEAASYPRLPIGIKRLNNVSPEFSALAAEGDAPTATDFVKNVQTGGGSVPKLLQDAFINFHGLVPHHDFTVGQYKPTFSEEGFSPSSMLDFVERTLFGDQERDLGFTAHGTWWGNGGGGPYCGGGDNGRLQYWLSIFDGAGNYFGSAGQLRNRSDDNDNKDLLVTLLLRPIWSDDNEGKLELGGSAGWGRHGEGRLNEDLINTPTDPGLNRPRTDARRFSVYGKYFGGCNFRGLWFKSEMLYIRDRNAPQSVIDLLGTGDPATLAQTIGSPMVVRSLYGSVGYKMGEGCCKESKCTFLRALEPCFRYEESDNIWYAVKADPLHTTVDHTRVYTLGLNYYIKGHNAKIQANYNFVRLPNGPRELPFHQVDSDSFIVNFQVMW